MSLGAKPKVKTVNSPCPWFCTCCTEPWTRWKQHHQGIGPSLKAPTSGGSAVGGKPGREIVGALEIEQGFRLPVFQRRAQRQLVRHQKFLFFDAGVFRSLRPRGPMDAPEEIEGLALEGLVAQHLRALCQLRAEGGTLSFWRTRSGLEVDFIAYGPGLFLAVEVKRTTRVSRNDLKGLKAFQADHPEAQCLLLSFCPEPLLIDGIRCEPLEGWLRTLQT